ncbi:hypothetical protein R1sor_005067 [Riccia sorocarpa]|uniref:Plant heme peroxidase family profile domain-containing protein n=1 Tax=Riccia sorocarpa TaxID=122646 RepID=A0ABD3HKQ0_9MARC
MPKLILFENAFITPNSSIDHSIRLAFHDCAVNGCDASILLNGGINNTDEKLSARNLGVGNLNIIDGMKALSCSDLFVLAARDAVRS